MHLVDQFLLAQVDQFCLALKQLRQESRIGAGKNIKSKPTIIKVQDRQHLKNVSKKQ